MQAAAVPNGTDFIAEREYSVILTIKMAVASHFFARLVGPFP
jgi:hypothetical protein